MNIDIKKVIYSNPVTTVIWADGSKTQSRCDKHDKFDELTGFMLCILKKTMPAKDMRAMFEDFVYDCNSDKIKRNTPKKKKNTKTILIDDEAIRKSLAKAVVNTNITDKDTLISNVVNKGCFCIW